MRFISPKTDFAFKKIFGSEIEALNAQNLERLEEAAWGFNTREELLNWLQQSL